MENVNALTQKEMDCCNDCLTGLMQRSYDVRFLVLASTDGFEIAVNGKIDKDAQGRMAAMASSLLSLSQAVVKESDLASCEEVMVDGVNGRIVVMAVPGQFPELLLMAVTCHDVAIGRVLLEMRTACVELRRSLQVISKQDQSYIATLATATSAGY